MSSQSGSSYIAGEFDWNLDLGQVVQKGDDDLQGLDDRQRHESSSSYVAFQGKTTPSPRTSPGQAAPRSLISISRSKSTEQDSNGQVESPKHTRHNAFEVSPGSSADFPLFDEEEETRRKLSRCHESLEPHHYAAYGESRNKRTRRCSVVPVSDNNSVADYSTTNRTEAERLSSPSPVPLLSAGIPASSSSSGTPFPARIERESPQASSPSRASLFPPSCSGPVSSFNRYSRPCYSSSQSSVPQTVAVRRRRRYSSRGRGPTAGGYYYPSSSSSYLHPNIAAASSLPDGSQIYLPGEDGREHKYNVRYVYYRMTRSQAHEYMRSIMASGRTVAPSSYRMASSSSPSYASSRRGSISAASGSRGPPMHGAHQR